MAFQKGQSGNPGGRPKGSKNQTTTTVRSFIMDLINSEESREDIRQAFRDLEPWQKLQMFEKLVAYVLPKAVEPDEVENAAFSRIDIGFPDLMGRPQFITWSDKELHARRDAAENKPQQQENESDDDDFTPPPFDC